VSVTFRWTPEQFKAAVGQAIDKGLKDAAMVGSDIAARQLGTQHGGKPSKPGNPPNSQTGTLRRSHGWELNRPRVARYGVGVFYGPILQDPNRLNRPWLLIPIQRHRQRLNQRFTRSAVAVMKARAQ
jgi:hypothetical protein